jgi:very-short-patch-repair endonuclease
VEVVDVLRAHGGSARWKQIRSQVGWRAVKRARAGGSVRQTGRVYHLPDDHAAALHARAAGGVRSHTTAAAQHRLALPPGAAGTTHVTVPRRARPRVRENVELHYRDLPASAVEGDVTSLVQTVVDCLRDEPLRTALCVGDSALAEGRLTRAALRAYVARLRGPGSARVRERIELLDGRAANAFESSARAILLEAGLTGFEPQVPVRHLGTFVGRVDLSHRGLRIVVECDGFEHHGERDRWTQDLLRHTSLVAAGWRPLRFTWEQVMFAPDWVLERVVETITGKTGEDAVAAARRLCRVTEAA